MSSSVLSGLKQCFTHDKTPAASFLNGFKNEPSYEFIDEAILKINLV